MIYDTSTSQIIPYQSDANRRQWAVLRFPLVILSTTKYMSVKEVLGSVPRKQETIEGLFINLQMFPQDDGARWLGPQGQQTG